MKEPADLARPALAIEVQRDLPHIRAFEVEPKGGGGAAEIVDDRGLAGFGGHVALASARQELTGKAQHDHSLDVLGPLDEDGPDPIEQVVARQHGMAPKSCELAGLSQGD